MDNPSVMLDLKTGKNHISSMKKECINVTNISGIKLKCIILRVEDYLNLSKI